MLGNNFLGIFRFQLLIENAFGIDKRQGTDITGTNAAGFNDFHLILQSFFRHTAYDCIPNFPQPEETQAAPAQTSI